MFLKIILYFLELGILSIFFTVAICVSAEIGDFWYEITYFISLTFSATKIYDRFELMEKEHSIEKIHNAQEHAKTNERLNKITGRNLERIKAIEKRVDQDNKNIYKDIYKEIRKDSHKNE